MSSPLQSRSPCAALVSTCMYFSPRGFGAMLAAISIPKAIDGTGASMREVNVPRPSAPIIVPCMNWLLIALCEFALRCPQISVM